MRRGTGTLLAVCLALGAAPAGAGSQVVDRFYEAKRAGTTRSAFERLAPQLARVRPGMSERELLAELRMEILAFGRQPRDARLDGYLASTSRRENRSAADGVRFLVFGWLEGPREVPRVRVALRDHRVLRVESDRAEEEQEPGQEGDVSRLEELPRRAAE